jgi:hypothetical protein
MGELGIHTDDFMTERYTDAVAAGLARDTGQPDSRERCGTVE